MQPVHVTETQLSRMLKYYGNCGGAAGQEARDNLAQWLRVAPDLIDCHMMAYNPEGGPIAEAGQVPLICPGPDRTFRALELVGPDSVRVVILGQDPYHTPDKASGLAFGYHPDYEGHTDSSLFNIVCEVHGVRPGGAFIGVDRTLENWARQGVLLLNTCLTVEEGKPLSHANIGWQQEILRLLKYIRSPHEENIMGDDAASSGDRISDDSKGTRSNIVWMLWGTHAWNVAAESGLGLTGPNVITTSHPCKYSNTRGHRPFTGSRCFSRANEYLTSVRRETIQW